MPYSGPGPGIWDLNLVGLDLKDLANVVLNFAMSFCISLASDEANAKNLSACTALRKVIETHQLLSCASSAVRFVPP